MKWLIIVSQEPGNREGFSWTFNRKISFFYSLSISIQIHISIGMVYCQHTAKKRCETCKMNYRVSINTPFYEKHVHEYVLTFTIYASMYRETYNFKNKLSIYRRGFF